MMIPGANGLRLSRLLSHAHRASGIRVRTEYETNSNEDAHTAASWCSGCLGVVSLSVAWGVAAALVPTFDAFVVRKLGAPGHEEFAVGETALGGRVVVTTTCCGA
jgi:hypothetical protein